MKNLSLRNDAVPRKEWMALLGCSLFLGCGGAPSSGEQSQVGTALQDLGAQLQNCASSALDCVKAADCDKTKEQACRDDFMSCRKANLSALEAFGQAVESCYQTKRQCIADARGNGGAGGGTAVGAGGSGGAASSPFELCHEAFRSCVQDNRPQPPAPGPCMQGWHDCIQAGDMTPRQCFDAAHQCFLNRLPMCGPSAAGSGGAAAGSGGGGGHG